MIIFEKKYLLVRIKIIGTFRQENVERRSQKNIKAKKLNEAFEKDEQEEITEAKKEDNTVITWPSGKKLKLVTNYHITEEDLDLFEEALRK